MGASNFITIAEGKTVEEAFNNAVSQAQHEEGHDGYTGTIAEKREYIVIDHDREARSVVSALKREKSLLDNLREPRPVFQGPRPDAEHRRASARGDGTYLGACRSCPLIQRDEEHEMDRMKTMMKELAEFYGSYAEWTEEQDPLLPWRKAYMTETLGKLEAFMAQLGYVVERKTSWLTSKTPWVARFDVDTAIRVRLPITDWPKESRKEGLRRGYEGR